MQIIKDYVRKNSSLLFKHHINNNRIAIFDNKGFSFTDETQTIYNKIKNQPHIYVAWTNNQSGNYYVGKSFQNGGRWKRQHAYHLGTLAYHLLNTTRNDDQNHAHWINHWMITNTISVIEENLFSIELKDLVYISFIPFSIYSVQNFNLLEKQQIKQINSNIERQLIQSYGEEILTLLNIQRNKKRLSKPLPIHPCVNFTPTSGWRL